MGEEVYLIPDLVVTTVYFIVTLALAEALRKISNFLFAQFELFESCIQEGIAAFELCAVCYEINILFEYENGIWIYGAYLFIASVWWSLKWENASSAPYTEITNWLFGETELFDIFLKIGAQVFGGMIFYQIYTKPLWSYGSYGEFHMNKMSETFCASDIQSPVVPSAFVEGGGVFISSILGHMTVNVDNKLGAVINSSVGTVLVLAALNISGGYYNPVLATATQYGCFGSTPLEHFSVYWVGETVGAILAEFLWRSYLHNYFGRKAKSD